MAYNIILDNEIDPGSPITQSLIERLANNPGELPISVSAGGGIGVETNIGTPSTLTPTIPSVYDTLGRWSNPSFVPYNTGALSVDGLSKPACMRRGSLVACFAFPNDSNVGANFVPSSYALTVSDVAGGKSAGFGLIMAGRYTNGVPTGLLLRNVASSPEITSGSSISGLLSAVGSSTVIPTGGGFTQVAVFTSGVKTFTVSFAAVVDLDAFYLQVRVVRSTVTGTSASESGYTMLTGV